MSEAAAPKLVTELKVTAHLMRLETGVFCIIQTPGVNKAPDASGLPGVRVTLAPNAPEGASIVSFRPDGWLSGSTDAAVVRVTAASTQLLVTIYQNLASTDPAPRLQVLRLSEDPNAPAVATAPRAAAAPRVVPEMVAHVQVKGDVGAALGDWIGEPGSKRWVEGFMIAPRGELSAADIEYQAVLGRGWLSPWSEGGQLCGSRGMSLPILGLRVRLKGDAAGKYNVSYEASFIDGSKAAAKEGGDACEATSLSPLEAFRVTVTEKGAAPKAGAPKALPPKAAAPAVAAKAPPPKPAVPPRPAAKPVAKAPVPPARRR